MGDRYNTDRTLYMYAACIRCSLPESALIFTQSSAFILQGERLSHAVGCAFAVCLERKQKRDKECSVTMNFDLSNSTFTRTGSFRHQPLTEKFQDTTNVSNNVTSPTANSTSNGVIPATTVININNNINTNYNRKGKNRSQIYPYCA